MRRYDAVVVGAGPAGSALATLLGRTGLSVCLVDRARFPREKVCGEYMSPQCLAILDRLGVLPELDRRGARRLRGLALRSRGGRACRGDYEPVEGYEPFRPYGLGMSREAFDEVLLGCAAAAPGVTVREGFNVKALLLRRGGAGGAGGARGAVVGVAGRCAGAAADERLIASVVVGADGARSRVSRLAGLARPPKRLRKFAFRAYYRDLADENRGELHLGDGCYAGIAPVEGGRTNVNLVVDRAALERIRGDTERFFEETLSTIPGMDARLAGSRRIGPVRGTGPMAWGCKSPVSDGVLLVGDAAAFVDPFTGEGIYMALRGAEIACEEIAGALGRDGARRGDLAGYRERWRAEFGKKIHACHGVQRFLYRSRIADYVIRQLGRKPAIRTRVLAATGDYLPPDRLMRPRVLLSLLNPWSAAADGGATTCSHKIIPRKEDLS